MKMYRDEIIEEVWKNRDAYTSKHHHNLAEMVADLKVRQERAGCKLVDRRNRTIGCKGQTARRFFNDPSPHMSER